MLYCNEGVHVIVPTDIIKIIMLGPEVEKLFGIDLREDYRRTV